MSVHRATQAVVGRLAPSPTGRLHLGHARTFLIAWWQARALGGVVRLRIEDLDAARCRPETIDDIYRDLAWLGLDWDGAPELQSLRADEMLAIAEQLVERGLAYPCVCSRGDIRAHQSAPHETDAEPRYPGTCRGRFESITAAEALAGRPAGLRFIAPDREVPFYDHVFGHRSSNVQAQVGDFMICRRDRKPAYQLAVVFDDARQGVTHVVRGSDLLPSTARQKLLQEALGYAHPSWFHVPLVVDADGARLAKRRGDLTLAELRERGCDPRAVVSWAARSVGITSDGPLTAAEAIRSFEMGRITKESVPIGHAPVRLGG